jgi:hypothetical protein
MILLIINRVPRQVVELGPSCVGQVNGEKLDDEVVFIHPALHACFAIILDDIIWRLKMFQKTRVMHVAPECLGP